MKKSASQTAFSQETARARRLRIQAELEQQRQKATIFYKDVAILRFNDDEQVNVVNEAQFQATFQKRANNDYWKTVNCIQTNVKSKLGIGKPIIIEFSAPLLQEDPGKEINFNFRQFEKDDAKLIKQDKHQYCLKSIHKMCYYI